MSDTLDHDEDDLSLLAAEYVLGTLDLEQRVAVAARADHNLVLAGYIADWEEKLAPLAMLVPPVAPPADLWPRISAAMSGSNVVYLRTVRRWRAATAAAVAIAAGLAFAAFLPRASHPVEVASLGPLDALTPAFVARVLPDGGLNVVAIHPAAVPTGKDLELWAMPPGATKPVSLGVLPAGGRRLAASSLTMPGGKLLISLEPKGGSPTGLPTGPVLYGGTLSSS